MGANGVRAQRAARRDVPPRPPGYRVGVVLAIAGAAVGLAGTLGLSIEGTEVPVPQPCPEFGCGPYTLTPQAVVFQPYIPLWLGILVALAATVPLVVLIRPRFWREGILAVMASEGTLGGLGLLTGGLYGEAPWSSPLLVFLLLWLVGASLTATGFGFLRSREAARTVRHSVTGSA
jgi:hypothetical protein